MKPYGLVLAGGGAKGAYELGAWKAMKEIGVTFSCAVGTSIGAINSAFIAADDYEGALNFWNEISLDKGIKINIALPDPDNLFSAKNLPGLFKEFIKNGGIDASPTKDFLVRYIDEQKVRSGKARFGMVTVQLAGMNPIEIFIDDIPQGQLIDHLLASAKIPGVNKTGPGTDGYIDGGVYDNAPSEMLRKNGYNRLIIVDISSMKGIGHTRDFSCSEIVYIRPHNIDELGAAFDFDNELNEKRMLLGYYDTRKAFGYLSGRIYYFEGDNFTQLVHEFGAEACSQLENLAYELGLDKLRVYNKLEFMLSLKKLYDDRESEPKSEEEAGGFYENLLRRVGNYRTEKEYSQAIAVLDNLII